MTRKQACWAAGWLEGDEPQKETRVMDSWYLYHSLLNLSRLALSGNTEKGEAMFRVLGDPRLSCRLRIMPTGRAELPSFKVITESGETSETLKSRKTLEGHIEYELFGDRTVIVQ